MRERATFSKRFDFAEPVRPCYYVPAYDVVWIPDSSETRLIEQGGGSVRVRVRAQVRASRTEIVGEHDGALKIRIAAPPVDGAANEELVRHVAKRVGVAQSRVRILSGGTARSKVVEIDGVDAATVRRALLE